MKHIRECKTHDVVRTQDGEVGVVCKRKGKFGVPLVLISGHYRLLVDSVVEVLPKTPPFPKTK